jgi:hypothetical protein
MIPKSGHRFSVKIMRQLIMHDPEKLTDFSDEIMRQ